MTSSRPFSIEIPPAAIEDLRERLARTRPTTFPAKGWSLGTDPGFLAEFLRSWSDFDWRAAERRWNAREQRIVTAGDAEIHVVRVAGVGEGEAMPLILTHGWPSSFVEFSRVIGPLSDPARFGGHPRDAFDVVIPSLPGFGFSPRLPAGETHPERIAGIWAEVMEELGYARFGAYGGDIGSHVTNFLGAAHPDRVVGVVTHHPALHPPLESGPPLTAAEEEYLAARAVSRPDRDDSYAAVQAGRPASLAPGLSDSPAGLAAWLLDKYRDWSDDHDAFPANLGLDALLEIVSLSWFSASIGTSFLPYIDDPATPALPPVTVPAGLLLTPEDAGYPREFAERTYTDIRFWSEPAPGGHFLALENPQRLVDGLREFFRPLRTS
jgi:epoxide hydrolase